MPPDNAPSNSRKPPFVPATEEQILAAGVGNVPRSSGPIVIADYDPAWPRLYAREAERVHAILGDRVVLLEHVGSTSVPGLAAKPRIDILLVVADSADEPAYVAPLEAAGYVLAIREADWHQHRLLRGPDADINLHVFSPGSPRSTACCASATGSAPTTTTAPSTSAPSATSPVESGSMSRTMPTPRPR